MYNFKNEIQHIKYLFNKQNVYYIIVKLNSMPKFSIILNGL